MECDIISLCKTLDDLPSFCLPGPLIFFFKYPLFQFTVARCMAFFLSLKDAKFILAVAIPLAESSHHTDSLKNRFLSEAFPDHPTLMKYNPPILFSS